MTLDLDPGLEAWAVITSHPLDNALDQIEVRSSPKTCHRSKGSDPAVPGAPKEGYIGLHGSAEGVTRLSAKLLPQLERLQADGNWCRRTAG